MDVLFVGFGLLFFGLSIALIKFFDFLSRSDE